MVAYDSRRTPDPAQQLMPRTVEALRAALLVQKNAGQEPVPELRAAIRLAAADAESRHLRPENVLAELNGLLTEIVVDTNAQGSRPSRGMREWLVLACVRAYWAETE